MRNMKIIAGLFFGLLMLTIVPFVEDVRADPPSPHPYDYIYAPGSNTGTGFGHNYVKLVNWTFFKNKFQTHTNWSLEYKRYSYSSWTDGSSYLSIQKTWNDSGFWKFKLTLNVPVNIYSARFTFGIDINCLQYINRSGTEIFINYTANVTEIYHCVFNYSDIINIPNLIITRGKTNNKMWFRFQKDTINAGTYVFDPIFGNNMIYVTQGTIENLIDMYYDGNCYAQNTFIPKYFMIYLIVTTKSHKVKCAIYDMTSYKICQSEEKIIPVSTGWNKFNITTNYLVPGANYYLAAWSNSTTGDCKIVSNFGDGTNHFNTYTYAANFPNSFSYLVEGYYSHSIYCYYVSLEPLKAFNNYPVNKTYTYKNVTISFDINHNGGKYNYSFYKKYPGASTFSLIETKNNLANNTYFYKWFNASVSVTNYTWKVACKNYSFNYWHNYTFWFYINDSTVHLSDTKTNVAGTLTSKRNNTGFWITSIHNSSITPYNHAVNSTLVHQYYWVTNTWKDYANSTGNTTAIHTSDTKKNVSGSLSYILNNTGYWVTSSHESKLVQFTNLINAFGTHTGAWNGAAWVDYANITGNASGCNSTNLTLYENFVDAVGTHQSFYDPLLGWFAWANVTGNASTNGTGNYTVGINLTGFNGYISWSGDHIENLTNISFPVTSNMSINGSVHVDEDAYFLSGMLSFDPAVMILSLFFGFFYIGYESKKRSGGFFMLFAGFLLIALGILVYGMLGYAAVLVVPFAIFIMLLGGKKAFYGPETEESHGDKPTK